MQGWRECPFNSSCINCKIIVETDSVSGRKGGHSHQTGRPGSPYWKTEREGEVRLSLSGNENEELTKH